jgi:hypothetical protein
LIAHAETAITTIRRQREFRRKEAHTFIANIDWHTSNKVKLEIPNFDKDFGSDTDEVIDLSAGSISILPEITLQNIMPTTRRAKRNTIKDYEFDV